MPLTLKLDLDTINMNHHFKHLRQRSSCFKVLLSRHTHIDTYAHIRPSALPEPLNWLVIIRSLTVLTEVSRSSSL